MAAGVETSLSFQTPRRERVLQTESRIGHELEIICLGNRGGTIAYRFRLRLRGSQSEGWRGRKFTLACNTSVAVTLAYAGTPFQRKLPLR